jgi:DNA replication and repair protein RecF
MIDVLFEKNEIEQRLSFSYEGDKKVITHNGTPLAHFSGLIGIIQGVTLTPYDIEIIEGPPKTRRHFLDLYLSQTHPLYLHYLNRFHAAMQQRNLLLKKRAKSDFLDPFEQIMSQAAKVLHQHRLQAIGQLSRSGFAEALTLEFHPSVFTNKSLSREYELGYTLSGPHKDDFSILLNGKPAQLYASEGQKRSAAMSLKLAQYEHQKSHLNCEVLLCIDDVAMGFDANRIDDLMRQLKSAHQVFLTSCTLSEKFYPQQVLQIESGRVTKYCLQDTLAPLQEALSI